VVRLGGGGEGEQRGCDGEEDEEAATAAVGGDEHATGRRRDLSGRSVRSRAVGFGFGPRCSCPQRGRSPIYRGMGGSLTRLESGRLAGESSFLLLCMEIQPF
jgi:hypothetical protein